jgi:tetratricopeptide (TPR) repeat protein
MHWAQGHCREAVEKVLPVLELARSLHELYTLVLARRVCSNSLEAMGDGVEAQIHATADLEAAERWHSSMLLVTALENNTSLAMLKGEWKVAQEFIARGLAESPKGVTFLVWAAVLNLQIGNIEESGEYVKQILEAVPEAPVGAGFEYAVAAAAIPLIARVMGTTDRLVFAESVAREILSSQTKPNVAVTPARIGLGLIAIQRSDAESAKEQYSFLKSEHGTQPPFQTFCADRLLGLLAQTMGNLDDSQSHFDDALAFCRKAGYVTELAWSLCDYADMLLERDGSTDQYMAKALFDESLSISTDLGMRSLKERVLSRRDILKA